ncbi:hypothetical protein BGZ47_011403 [Haplosporangium gracile]|nr:hypothetical protein BGZ47_011403 [Haplosporangium gracile]
MAPKSIAKNPAPKSKKAKDAKPAHPFSSAAMENAFYFVRTAPRLYSAIFLASPDQQYFDQGKRLKFCWETTRNGLGAFWEEREDAKTASDIEDAARDNIRKHSIRSAERNVLGAIRNLDDQTRGLGRRRTLSERKIPIPEHFAIDNGQGFHATGSFTKSRDGNDNSTQDSEAHQSNGSPEASDADQALDGPEDQTAESNVNRAPMHGPQEIFDADHVSKGDNTGTDTRDEDDLPSQKSTVLECERSSSLSRGIYYLTGDGSKDCSKNLWTPWLVNGHDLGPTLWKYRERIIDAAQRVVPLTSSVEKLAVNHIYLFERNDADSSLFDAVGLEDWRAVISVTSEKGVEDTTVLELQKLALELGNLSHRESEELILSWNGNTSIKKVLVGLVENDFLGLSPPFNEHEQLIHVFDPFLKAYICGVKGSIGRWDQAFPPSQNRKKGLDENSLGRRPDFMLRTSLRGIICYLFFMEAKKVRQGAAVVQDDLEKMAGMMKDAIDDMSKQGIDVGNVEVIGLHIIGTEGHLYAMKLEARGIYVLRSIAAVYTPKSHFNFGVLTSTINVLVHVQKRLEKTITDILASHAAGGQGQDLTRPGFHTPTHVLKA